MEKLTVIYQAGVFVFLCIVWFIVVDQSEKTKSFISKFKGVLLVVCAGLTWSKFGRNIFVMIAFVVIGIIAMAKRKRNNGHAKMGAGT